MLNKDVDKEYLFFISILRNSEWGIQLLHQQIQHSKIG
jgi:hypothetical protein